MSTLEMGGNFSAAMFSPYRLRDPEGQGLSGRQPSWRVLVKRFGACRPLSGASPLAFDRLWTQPALGWAGCPNFGAMLLCELGYGQGAFHPPKQIFLDPTSG